MKRGITMFLGLRTVAKRLLLGRGYRAGLRDSIKALLAVLAALVVLWAWTANAQAPPQWDHTFPLDTTKLSNGPHTLEVTAFDAAGNSATQLVEFVVENDLQYSDWLRWEPDPMDDTEATGYRVRCKQPGTLLSRTKLVDTDVFGIQIGNVVNRLGVWTCTVTAVAGTRESPPSDPVTFTVVAADTFPGKPRRLWAEPSVTLDVEGVTP